MTRFVQLFHELDTTNRTSGKVEALAAYFREARPEDAAWAAAILSGRKLIKSVSSTLLRQLVSQETQLPEWLVQESYDAVGDLSETISLLLPDRQTPSGESLQQVVEKRVLPLEGMNQKEQAQLIVSSWGTLSHQERFLYHKLISTAFRVGVSRQILIRALAEVSGVPGAVIDHRLKGTWKPSAEAFGKIMAPAAGEGDPHQAYPFLLAHPWEKPLEDLGNLADWHIEWKWDGIRCQVIRRGSQCVLWSRGDELVSDAFPELVQAACHLPEGTVLDGEILAWEAEKPMPFLQLQKRLNRKTFELSFWPEVPVILVAYDLLELAGQDQRALPLSERRQKLEELLRPVEAQTQRLFRLSPVVGTSSWQELQQLKGTSRERGVEGFMLKRRDSAYAAGRPRGLWWKAKVQPYTLDAVLYAAQPGTGKRAGLFTDYTFAIRKGQELVPVAKAYSGLTDEEIGEVDRWVRKHTLSKHGPVRIVEPEQVFELGFEAIQESTRHKSGVAVRFPRILRWRKDKRPGEIDTLETLRELMRRPGTEESGTRQRP